MRRSALILAVLASLALPSMASAWPTWGSLTSNDCAFAAAANWELLHGGTNATEASILAEYREAAKTEEGISGEVLESYWRKHGIGGRREDVHDTDATNPSHLYSVMHRHDAIIVELAVTPGQRWGRIEDHAGGIHFAVVRYITRRGPVVLTWGRLGQMTWWQWNEDALLLYVPTAVTSRPSRPRSLSTSASAGAEMTGH